MKRLVVVIALLSSHGFAEKGSEVEFQINQTMVVNGSSISKTKVGDADETEATSSTTETFPTDLELAVTVGKIHFYLFPVNPGSALGVGFDVIKDLEVGINLGLNSSKVDKPKQESSTTEYGVFAVYSLQIGKPALEIGFEYMMASGSTESEVSTTNGTASTTTKTDTTASSATFGLTYVHPIAGGFSYLFGANYTMGSSEESESKTKTSSTGTELQIAGARIDF